MFLLALAGLELLNAWPALVALAICRAVYLRAGLIVTLAVVGAEVGGMGRYRPPRGAAVVALRLADGIDHRAVRKRRGAVGPAWAGRHAAPGPGAAPFGARVGRRVYLETTFLTEFDLVRVGDDAAVAGQAALQTHLFEGGMKMSVVTIGPGCTVGARSVVLYDTELAAGADLDAPFAGDEGRAIAGRPLARHPAHVID